MANVTELGPRAFVPFDRLDYSPQSPKFIIKQTDVALSARRETENEDLLTPGKIFLLEDSINFVDLMEQGIHYDNQATASLTKAELERALETTAAIPGRGFYARESFRIAVATWAQIPEYIRVVRFGASMYQLSRRGRFAPPVTTIEQIEKLEEIRAGIIDATFGRDTSAREMTEVFFRVASCLPMKENN